jgi:hypothetical protein
MVQQYWEQLKAVYFRNVADESEDEIRKCVIHDRPSRFAVKKFLVSLTRGTLLVVIYLT